MLMIIAYLRNLNAARTRNRSERRERRELFASQCATCHRVGDKGGRLGPDLSRVGAARSRSALVREIRTPSEWVLRIRNRDARHQGWAEDSRGSRRTKMSSRSR